MDVEGERMKGEGRVFYQATLPLRGRTRLSPPPEQEPAATTEPATPEPAATPK